MNAETLTALKASIAHWEKNAAAKTRRGVKMGVGYCALCSLFWLHNCKGCPIARATGKSNCHDTPYVEADTAHGDWIFKPKCYETRSRFQSAARKEVAFLKSLLPKGEE